MNKQQPEPTLSSLLQGAPLAAASMTEEDQIWLGVVPGQRLPLDFLQLDADALRQLFITAVVSADVWSAAVQLFDDDESSAIHWLCEPVFGLGGQRPVDVIRTAQGKEAVMNIIGQLMYGFCL